MTRTGLVLAVACAALGCASPPPSPRTTAVAAASSYDANATLLADRYCRPIAALSARVLDACGCPAEERASHLVSDDELVASCTYHLVGRLPEGRALRLDEPALARCLRELDAAMNECTRARLPEACELGRIVAGMPERLALSRPEGSECRASNGDEGFDAHFLCASGLTCEGTCRAANPPIGSLTPGPSVRAARSRAVPARASTPAVDSRAPASACAHPLDLPGAFP